MINQKLTQLLKRLIVDVGLVDSGNMLNNTQVDLIVTNRVIIDILTTDYFVFQDQKHGITNAFINSKELADEVGAIYIEMLSNRLITLLSNKKGDENNFNFQPLLLINGV